MNLVAEAYRGDGRGGIQAVISLVDDSGGSLYQDLVLLSRQNSRGRFAKILVERFPELKGKDIEAQLLQLLWQARSEPGGEAKGPIVSQADRLVKLVVERGVELFHTPTTTAYARILMGDHKETHRCRGQGFRQWLSRELFCTHGKVPNSDALNSAITAIEGKANFDGQSHQLCNRVGLHEGSIYYDLADEKWRAVRVNKEGWEVVNEPPILFSRYQHQKPQVLPQHGGRPERLLDFVNLKDDAQRLLLLVYAISCFIPEIPHPILHVYGEQGSAKTTLFKMLGGLIDPSAEGVLMFPRDLNELAQKLAHHWGCFFDNLGTLPDWTSDMLSRAVTGAGFSKRELYTDEGDVIFELKRCIGLNGINIVARKPDLLGRCILVELGEIPAECRRGDAELSTQFEEAKPEILGGFFDVLSVAMGIYPEIQLHALPRMADFARWGAAISEALGHEAGEFPSAYEANIRSQNVEVLTSSPVASTLMAFMEGKDSYAGTPAELLDELTQQAETLKIKTNVKSWPAAPQTFTRRLNELRGNLRSEGLQVDTGSGARVEGRWHRMVKIKKIQHIPVPRSSENTVASVASLRQAQDLTDLSVEKGNGVLENSVAPEQIPLRNDPPCNGIGGTGNGIC